VYPQEDSERLLDPLKWPAHIAVSRWVFKKRVQPDDVNRTEVKSALAPPMASTGGAAAAAAAVDAAVASIQSAGGVGNSAVHSTPTRRTSLSTEMAVDLDSTIISNHGDAP